MDRIRQAMERALEQKWTPSVRPAVLTPAVRRTTERTSVSAGKPSRRTVPYVPVSEDVLERNRLVAAINESPHREAYSVLQANVVERLVDRDWGSLGVTGPVTGIGKTLTAINLSIALAAQASRKVLLLDLDLSSPSVHEYFEYEPKVGLEDCLFDGSALTDVAFESAIDGLTVLPTKSATYNGMQILQSGGLRDLLDQFKKDDPDRIIIADMPSVSVVDDARAYSALVDGMLLVVEDTETRDIHLRKALAAIGRSQLLGIVLNKTQAAA